MGIAYLGQDGLSGFDRIGGAGDWPSYNNVARAGLNGLSRSRGSRLVVRLFSQRTNSRNHDAKAFPQLGTGRAAVDRRGREELRHVFTDAELLAHLADRSRACDCIVQPSLVNHPALRDLSNGALATLRIVTVEDEDGGFEVTHAVLRMAIGANTTVDNFHAGGIAAPVSSMSPSWSGVRSSISVPASIRASGRHTSARWS